MDFAVLIDAFRNCWKKCTVVVLVFVVGFGSSAVLLPNVYTSSALLAPVQDQTSALGGIVGQLGGLADLAGISGLDAGRQAAALATLKSRSLLEPFLDEEKLLPVLFPKKWDSAKQQWKSNDEAKRPTLWEGYRFFTKKVLSINEDRRTGLVTLSIEWKNAQQAAAWASEIVKRCNEKLQQQAISDSSRTVGYLRLQLQKDTSLEVQQLLYRLLETETKKMAVAVTRDEYAFRLIDAPVIPSKPEGPARMLILAAGILLGALTAISYLFYVASQKARH